jgi:inositol phosphorylceramide mannosyltransferase catalytic subunit
MLACSVRRAVFCFVVLLSLFLVGTVVVLATVKVYFGVDERDLVTPEEIARLENVPSLPYNAPAQNIGDSDDALTREKIPRIVHQTWKTDVLPERWQVVRQKCMEMHPE